MQVNDTVRTLGQLTRKDFIAPKVNKSLRRANAPGVIFGILGRRDERYLVLHEGETTPAVYLRDELDLEPNAYWKVTYSQLGFAYFVELATYRDVESTLSVLSVTGGKSMMVTGPFYSDKELTEGLLPARNVFDHLKDKD